MSHFLYLSRWIKNNQSRILTATFNVCTIYIKRILEQDWHRVHPFTWVLSKKVRQQSRAGPGEHVFEAHAVWDVLAEALSDVLLKEISAGVSLAIRHQQQHPHESNVDCNKHISPFRWNHRFQPEGLPLVQNAHTDILLLTQKLPQKGKSFIFQDLVLSHFLNICWSWRLIQSAALSGHLWILVSACRELFF